MGLNAPEEMILLLMPNKHLAVTITHTTVPQSNSFGPIFYNVGDVDWATTWFDPGECYKGAVRGVQQDGFWFGPSSTTKWWWYGRNTQTTLEAYPSGLDAYPMLRKKKIVRESKRIKIRNGG